MQTDLEIVSGYWARPLRRYLPIHKNAALEIVYVEAGHTVWQVDGERHEVVAGQVFFTLPWQEHGGTGGRERNQIYWVEIPLRDALVDEVSSFCFDPRLPLTSAEGERISRKLCGTSKHSFVASPGLRESLPRLAKTSRGGSYRILLAAIAVLELELSVTGVASAHSASPADDLVAGVGAHIRRDTSAHWTLERMAATAGLGRTRFAQLVHEATGETPGMLLRRVRIEAACNLLIETERPIVEIAVECGFSSSQYFATVFKQHEGCTPRAYRERGTTLRTP